MGRARGSKNRGASSNWPPEMRDLQARGGMSPDWHERWHQAGGGLGEIPAIQEKTSPVFLLSSEEIRSLKENPWDRWQILEIFNKVRPDLLYSLGPDDPVIEALWQQERLRLGTWVSGSPMQAYWSGAFEPDWKKIESFWKARLVDHIESEKSNSAGSNYDISWSLMQSLLREDSPGGILSEEDTRALRQSLEELLEDPAVFEEVARGDLLSAYAQGSFYNPFWLQTSDRPIQEDFSKALLRAWLPSEDRSDALSQLLHQMEEIDPSEEERNEFYSVILHDVASDIVRSSDNRFFPQGDPGLEEEVYKRARYSASWTMLGSFFRRLRDRPDFEECMEKICKDEWSSIRSQMIRTLHDYGHGPEELPGWVSERLQDKFIGKVSDSVIKGDRSIHDFAVFYLRNID